MYQLGIDLAYIIEVKFMYFTKLPVILSLFYIANCSRWKSFVNGKANFNLLENFLSLLIRLIFKKKSCSCALTKFFAHKMPRFGMREPFTMV